MATLKAVGHAANNTVAEEAHSQNLTGNSMSDRLNNSSWLQFIIALTAF
ncbi:hypothetical protein [Cognaticolwellia beringensis]|nr:hypothetical protein [Cognaticolwellia beringensis]